MLNKSEHNIPDEVQVLAFLVLIKTDYGYIYVFSCLAILLLAGS